MSATRSQLVSVLLPYRNCAATIEAALDSVISGQGVEAEVVAIDDGSTDAGPATVARLAARHPSIVPIATGGVGIARALSAGLARARGRFVARMDGDDLSRPGRLAAQLAALAAHPRAGAVGTRVEGFPDAAVGPGLRRYIDWQNAIITPAAHARALFIESPLCHPSVVLRREALAAVGGWRDVFGPEDYDLWLRLDAAGWQLAKVPEVLLSWRHSPGRATFSDPRFARDRFVETKAPHLARVVRARKRPVVIWGAGRTGKRLARALEPCGVRPVAFVDIDRNKIGRTARGAPVVGPAAIAPGRELVIVAVSALGARAEITQFLEERAFSRDDFVCAA